jgi:glutaredoxin-related protein
MKYDDRNASKFADLVEIKNRPSQFKIFVRARDEKKVFDGTWHSTDNLEAPGQTRSKERVALERELARHQMLEFCKLQRMKSVRSSLEGSMSFLTAVNYFFVYVSVFLN